MTDVISIVFASRGRPASLNRAVRSLTDRASDPDHLEVLVAVDPDDKLMLKASLDHSIELWTAPKRYGYTQLHEYLNVLAARAEGTWLMWWNDDMHMETDDWDVVVRGNRPAVLWPHANHVNHANIAPIWPRAWADTLGYASPSTHMDTYLQYLGERLGRHDRVPIHIVHDRADLTGHHNDKTYAEGRKLLGPEGMAPGFDATQFHLTVNRDADVIRGIL